MGVLDLLSRLVEIDTVNDPITGKRVGPAEGEAVRSAIREATGYEMKMIVNDGVPILLWTAGKGRPVTLFLAHFDTVPAGPGWSKEPFRLTVEGGKAYGRGAADDKSNVAALAWSLLGYEPDDGTIIVSFTGDEEIGGAKGAGYLAEFLKKRNLMPDYLVNGDGSLSRIIIRRRASLSASVRVRREVTRTTGCRVARRFDARIFRETMHSAYFVSGVDTHPLIEASLWLRDSGAWALRLSGEWVKSNVIPRSVVLDAVEACAGGGEVDVDKGLTRLLRALLPITRAPICTEAYSDYGVTINPNVYRRDGEWHIVNLDIRAMVKRPDPVERSLREVLDETLGAGSYGLSVRGGAGYLYTPPNSPLVNMAREIARSLHLGDEPLEAGGASDSRYFSPLGVDAIDFGPLGGNIHGPDEYVYVSHLEKATVFYRKLAHKIHGGSSTA
jgi:succinyl-diaminopimelate desuccinylase